MLLFSLFREIPAHISVALKWRPTSWLQYFRNLGSSPICSLCPWANGLSSLNLSFLICKEGIILLVESLRRLNGIMPLNPLEAARPQTGTPPTFQKLSCWSLSQVPPWPPPKHWNSSESRMDSGLCFGPLAPEVANMWWSRAQSGHWTCFFDPVCLKKKKLLLLFLRQTLNREKTWHSEKF